jgi:hypothetical protein
MDAVPVRRRWLNPWTLVGLSLVLVAVVGGVAYVAVTALFAGGDSGNITFEPSTVSCSKVDQRVAITIVLPNPVHSGDTIWIDRDGVVSGSSVETAGFERQLNGSWRSSTELRSVVGGSLCVDEPAFGMMPGVHTWRVYDGDRNVLAEGTLTLTP